jgi:hypothetical protein
MTLCSIDVPHEKMKYDASGLHQGHARVLIDRACFNACLLFALVISALIKVTIVDVFVAFVYLYP